MKNMFRKMCLLTLTLVSLLLTGCMSSNASNANQEIPYTDQLELIQKAVDAYQESNGGLLPIKTRDMSTDMYIKYPIEFFKLVPAYTEKIPANAFETGGIYQYVLMDVETNPTVKLVDIRAAERIRELNIRKNINGYVPFKDPVGEFVFEINFEEMGIKDAVMIPSPYSDALLPVVVGGDGNFYIDYSVELNRILMEKKPDVKTGDDIRSLLAEEYPVLPAFSLPYTVNEHNEPIFMKKTN